MRRAALVGVVLVLGCSGSSTKKQPVGGPCTPAADSTSADCASNFCVSLNSTSGVCSQDCAKNPTCPEGYSCQHAGHYGVICLKTAGCKKDLDCPAGHICD